MMTSIYAPKRPCPRDLGRWYCNECLAAHEKEQSEVDFMIPLVGCGRTVLPGWVCGETHLGHEWCDECSPSKRTSSHAGEFEIVGTIEEAR